MTKKQRIAELERKVEELERKAREPIIINVAPVIVPVVVPEPAPVWPWPRYPYRVPYYWLSRDYESTAVPMHSILEGPIVMNQSGTMLLTG